jgi:hypothetical protein
LAQRLGAYRLIAFVLTLNIVNDPSCIADGFK